MSQESRIKRWRANKRQQGLKQVSVWLTPEEELCLKDLAIQWHCSPSEVVQRALAHIASSPPDSGSPTDALRIRKLILAELEALGFTMPSVSGRPTVLASVGPTEILPHTTATEAPTAQAYEPKHGHSLRTESAPQERYGEMRAQILALLTEHPEGLSAEQIRVYLKAEKPLGDTLQGMRRQGKVHTRGKGKDMRYFVA